MKKIRKIGLIAIKDKKILLNRKRNTQFFLLPGGKPMASESPEDCLRREIREEHNCELENIEHFGAFEDQAANEDALVHIDTYTGNLKGEPRIGAEIVEQIWYARNDNPAKLSPIIKYKVIPGLIMERLL